MGVGSISRGGRRVLCIMKGCWMLWSFLLCLFVVFVSFGCGGEGL